MKAYIGCVVSVNCVVSFKVRVRRPFRVFVPVSSLAPTAPPCSWTRAIFSFGLKLRVLCLYYVGIQHGNMTVTATRPQNSWGFRSTTRCFCFRSRDLQAAESFWCGISWERRRHHLLVGMNDQRRSATNEHAALRVCQEVTWKAEITLFNQFQLWTPLHPRQIVRYVQWRRGGSISNIVGSTEIYWLTWLTD